MRNRKGRKKSIFCLIILGVFLFITGANKVYAADTSILVCIDAPADGATITGKANISGWALSMSGIQKVEMSVDGLPREVLAYGASRQDVANVYPSYPNAANSGYNYIVNTRKYSNGEHQLSIIATGNDGQTAVINRKVTVYNQQTPIMGQAVVTKDQMIRYFQSRNDVKSFDYINNFVNIVWEEAAIEGIKPDIAFAQMMKETGFLKFGGDVQESQNNFAGIGATGNGVPGASFPDIRTGIRAIIQHEKAYASKDPLNQAVVDPRYSLVNKGCAPYVEWLGIGANPIGAGWAVSENYGYEIVDMVNYAKTIGVQSSSAVLNSFTVPSDLEMGKSYSISGKATSGNKVLYQFSIRDYSNGNWTTVQDFSENSSFTWTPAKAGTYRIKISVKDIYTNKNVDASTYRDVVVADKIVTTPPVDPPPPVNKGIAGKTIVVDAGHNYGGDGGAVSGSYKELYLNMYMALQLRTELEKLGAKVIMTREASDASTADVNTSLQNRVDIANNANADLFISLHHDVSPSSSTTGISTHYSTYRPLLDTSGIVTGNDPNGWYNGVDLDTTPCDAAKVSKDLAERLVNGLSSGLGYVNQKAHDHNLFVTKNTKMPSILIENGFITNSAEAARCADSSEQQKKAHLIAQIINDYYLSIK